MRGLEEREGSDMKNLPKVCMYVRSRGVYSSRYVLLLKIFFFLCFLEKGGRDGTRFVNSHRCERPLGRSLACFLELSTYILEIR